MRKALLFLASLGPYFLGVAFPYCPLPGGLRLLNLFWGVVDGLGLWAIDETVGLSMDSRLLILGVLVWPIAVSAAMFALGLKLLRTMHLRLRLFVISALVATAFLDVDLNRALQPPLSHLPTFHRLFFAVW
jgi:hypothetical protein